MAFLFRAAMVGNVRSAALSQKAALQLPFPISTLSVKMRLERSAERDKREISANYAQSATTTTAASGGNREELLGQRPARRECRPRHDADAGCRNPENADGIPNRPATPERAGPA